MAKSKVELTKEELVELAALLALGNEEDWVRGHMIETDGITIEVVCSDCHGTGEVEEGQFDDIRTVKCHCQIKEHDGDGEDD